MEYGRLWVELKYWDKQRQLIAKNKRLYERFDFYRKWIKKIIALVKINASISEMKRTSFIVKVN